MSNQLSPANVVIPAATPIPAPGPGGSLLAAAATHENIFQKIEHGVEAVEHKVLSVLDLVGKDAAKSLAELSTYLPEAAAIAGILYPPAQAVLAPVINFVQLAQQAVITIKAKAALFPAGLSDAEMLADELQLIEPTAIQLLADAGIKADSAYIAKVVKFIVALLDLKQVPVAA